VTPQLLSRLLRAHGVELVSNGKCLLVPLSEIERRIPPLWRSIQTIERLRADVARGTIVPPDLNQHLKGRARQG
jgi:hypothetical protein